MQQKEKDYKNLQRVNKSTKEYEKKLAFSAYTLQITDSNQSASFNKYQREEVKGRLKYLLICLHVCSAFVIVAYCWQRITGVPADTLWFFTCQIVPVTLSMSLGYCSVMKNIKFVELQGINLIGTQMLLTAFTNYSGLFEMDRFRHYSQFDISCLYFLLYIGLLTTQFKWHFLLRTCLILPSFMTLMSLTMQQDFE